MSKHQHALTHQDAIDSSDVHAAVLAGGMSRRFGSDKCLATLPGDDRTLLTRVVEACREVAGRVVIIGGDRAGTTDLSDGVIQDSVMHGGPLVGLQAALLDCRVRFLLLAACDQPLLTGALLRRLVDRRSESDVVMFAVVHERPNPFPSLLRRETVLPIVEARIRAGYWSMRSVYESPELQSVSLEVSTRERASLEDIDTLADLQSMAASLPLGNDFVR
jgi:molybdenum cofactor guanylyltransferase